MNRSPDLARNLEVADFVTSKKANMCVAPLVLLI